MNKICKAITKSGKSCRMLPLKDDNYCYIHSNKTVEEKKISLRNGGKRKVYIFTDFPEVKLKSISDINRFIALMINKILKNEMDLRIGTGINYLLMTLIKSLELSEIEQRLNKIEKKLII